MDATSAIQRIEKSKHVGLVLSADQNYDVLAAAEVMAQFLASRGIYVGMVTPLDTISLTNDTAFPTLISLKPLTKELIIALDTAAAPISQLRYENADNRVDIILSPSSSAVAQDHISFHEGKTQCDCVIAIGVSDIEQLDTTTLHVDPLFFSETPLIDFDISAKNKLYGEVNVVDSSLASLSELIYRFLAAFPDHTIPSDSATLLLSGILHRTNGFTTLTDAHTLLSGHELIRLGANYEAAHMLSRVATPFSLMPLVGRALARSRVDNEKNIAWSLITQDDFLATRHAAQDIAHVARRIEKEFPRVRTRVLLWQHPNTQKIHAHIAANIPLLELLREKTNMEFKDTHAELTNAYDSFPDAERAITALLDAVL